MRSILCHQLWLLGTKKTQQKYNAKQVRRLTEVKHLSSLPPSFPLLYFWPKRDILALRHNCSVGAESQESPEHFWAAGGTRVVRQTPSPVLWRMMSPNGPHLRVQAPLERKGTHQSPVNKNCNTIMPAKYTERTLVASKGNLNKTLCATAAKRKHFLHGKVSSSRMLTSKERGGFPPLKPPQVLYKQ